MKKLFVIVSLALFSGSSLFAGAKDKNKGNTDDKKNKKDDTTKVVFTNEALLDEVDSLLMFPSHDLYGSWDTSVIHPYTFDKEFITDSASIYLLDEWNCGFSLPYRGAVTSEFGWRRRRPHFGTDINLETGDTVVAAFNGKVRIAKLNHSYGNVVIIRHNNGLETVYAHLSKILVDPEQEVTAGTVVGLGGNTGHSYGSHLHFEIRYLGKAIDAEDLINFETGDVKNNTFVLYKDDFNAKYDLRNIYAKRYSRSYATSRHGFYKGKSKKYSKTAKHKGKVKNTRSKSVLVKNNSSKNKKTYSAKKSPVKKGKPVLAKKTQKAKSKRV